MAFARAVGGFLVGYVSVVLLTTFGFNVLLAGHHPIANGGILVILAGTMVAIVSGATGGAVATRIGGSRWAGMLVALPLVIESTWLLFFRHRAASSSWFDRMGALTLVTATLLGGYFAAKTSSPPRSDPE
jgi:hypothetical protein